MEAPTNPKPLSANNFCHFIAIHVRNSNEGGRGQFQGCFSPRRAMDVHFCFTHLIDCIFFPVAVQVCPPIRQVGSFHNRPVFQAGENRPSLPTPHNNIVNLPVMVSVFNYAFQDTQIFRRPFLALSGNERSPTSFGMHEHQHLSPEIGEPFGIFWHRDFLADGLREAKLNPPKLSASVSDKQLIVAIRIQINDCIHSPDFLPSGDDRSEWFRSGKVVGNQGNDADKDDDGKCFSH
jgi:hypothetical protein